MVSPEFEYDAEGRLRRIRSDSNDILAEYSYDDLSRRTLLTLGNDANVVYEYDLANRLTKLTNHLADPNTLAFAYDNYDHVGNRLSLKIDDANEQVYAYDSVYRLTYVDYNDGNDMSFYYDALGNRWRTINGGTVNYQTNNLNQYTSVAGTSYTYDDNGNLAFDGQLRYYYDCESRLIDINDANDAPVASYAYDYLGRRISRTIYGAPDVTIKYAYDGDRIIAEYDANDVLLRKFIYGPGIDEPICLIEVADNNAVYYYHFDGLGSVVALSDVNSVLVERYTYDVFGRATIRDPNGTEIAASAFANPYLFTGRAYDGETGLYYYRARYYDYATGRFLQPDPTGYTDGLNLYTYVGNNPLSWADPFGLCKEETGKAKTAKWKVVLAAAAIGITFATPWPGDEELSTILLGNLVLGGFVYNAVCQPGFEPAALANEAEKPFRGSDSLRAHNNKVRYKCKEAGLTDDEEAQVHDILNDTYGRRDHTNEEIDEAIDEVKKNRGTQ